MPAICMFYNKKNKVRLVFAPKSKSEIAVALFQSPKTFFFIRNTYRLLHKYHRGYISK